MERKLSKKNIVGIVFVSVACILAVALTYYIYLQAGPDDERLSAMIASLTAIFLGIPILVFFFAGLSLCSNCKPFRFLPLVSTGTFLTTIALCIVGYSYVYHVEEKEIEYATDYTSIIYELGEYNNATIEYFDYETRETGVYLVTSHEIYDLTINIETTRHTNGVFYSTRMLSYVKYSVEEISATFYSNGQIETSRVTSGFFGQTKIRRASFAHTGSWPSFETLLNAAKNGK